MPFLGMVGYYLSFCNNFSETVAPLTDFVESVTCVWLEFNLSKYLLKCEGVVDKCSSFCCTAVGQTVKMHVDACEIGAEAVLLQDDGEGVERPVCFCLIRLIIP